MIIIQLAGGLGNQLQQYALYCQFIQIGTPVKLDLSWFEGDCLKNKRKKNGLTKRKLELACLDGVEFEHCTKKEKEELIGGDRLSGKLRRRLFPQSVHFFQESRMYHPEVFSLRDAYITGYFACERYYKDILGELREKIKFPESKNPLNKKMAQDMENCESVSVHIRRGDYLNAENAAMFGKICTDEYYQKAMEIIKEKVPEVQFYLFSDDPVYVREKYAGENVIIVDINHGEDSFYDMWLMSCCRHNICANSTFSFWGARLNANENKIMIRPTIHKNSQIFVKEEMERLWPGWLFISPDGEVK